MPAVTALRALAPAAALAVLAGGAGTFTGGASAAGAAVGHAVVLAAALYAAGSWRDPLRLGWHGRWLTAALGVAVLASWAASPVARAGLVAVLTLPAWLLAPAAVARCWRDGPARRLGLTAVALVVTAVAATALAGRLLFADPRASAPLGHHNLLAVWLLALLPLAASPARARGAGRVLALTAVAAALAALGLTGSLAGLVGLGVVATLAGVLLVVRHTGVRWMMLAVAALLAAVATAAGPRLFGLLAGTDPSLAARSTYWAAGWRGFLQRTSLGWGPGAVPWTVGEWLRPVPGVNPPGQVVGDLHSLPLQLAYETGLAGLALVAATLGLFAWRRWRGTGDRATAAAGLLALAGAGTALLTTAPLAVTAVPAALAVAAGAALSAEPGDDDGGGRGGRRGWPVLLFVLLAAVLLTRLDLAQRHYERWRSAGERAAAELAAAVRLDPAFPLYRARLATDEEGAEDALRAAEGAPGVAALWLSAGSLGAAAGEGWSGAALRRACALDPLSAAAPFLLAVRDPAASAAPLRAARALVAEPRLAAALAFEGREELLAAALEEVEGWPGVDAGWRRAMVETVRGWDVDVAGEVARLNVVADGGGAGDSLSLHSFRRRPRRWVVTGFAVRRELARQVDLPPAAVRPESAPAAFASDLGCAPNEG